MGNKQTEWKTKKKNKKEENRERKDFNRMTF